MLFFFELLLFLGYLAAGFVMLIKPAYLTAREILKHKDSETPFPLDLSEVIGLIVLPFCGYLFLGLFRETAELLDWNYFIAVFGLMVFSIVFYFISRIKRKKSGPLTLALIPTVLLLGISLCLLQLIHFAPFFIMGSMLITTTMGTTLIFLTPFFGLIQAIILMSAELKAVLDHNKNYILEQHKSPSQNELLKFYFGNNALLAQVITFPLFATVMQFIFIVFTGKSDSIIQAFKESADGTFSQGYCELCPTPSCYVCTIAAHGSPGLVKPIHAGYRNGNRIMVNRQLKVCNAFEELIKERAPKIHKPLRAFYDSLNIPVERWKHIRPLANLFYILLKPFEWLFLITLYLVDPAAKARIHRQYH